MKKCWQDHFFFIPCALLALGTTEFGMSDRRVELLIEAGRNAARGCLAAMGAD